MVRPTIRPPALSPTGVVYWKDTMSPQTAVLGLVSGEIAHAWCDVHRTVSSETHRKIPAAAIHSATHARSPAFPWAHTRDADASAAHLIAVFDVGRQPRQHIRWEGAVACRSKGAVGRPRRRDVVGVAERPIVIRHDRPIRKAGVGPVERGRVADAHRRGWRRVHHVGDRGRSGGRHGGQLCVEMCVEMCVHDGDAWER